MKQRIDHRDKDQRDQGRAGEAADDGPGQGGLGVGSFADAKARGMRPRMVVNVVIRIGRNLRRPASIRASRVHNPSWINRPAWSTSRYRIVDHDPAQHDAADVGLYVQCRFRHKQGHQHADWPPGERKT
jgi:hypothetical protein